MNQLHLYSGTPLTLADLHQVHTTLYDARARWFDIGQCLSVDNETLQYIRQEFTNDGDRLRELLAIRLNASDRLTWAMLWDCLREPNVARDDVANDIEKKILSSQGIPYYLEFNTIYNSL